MSVVQIGDRVKVFTQVGLMKKSRWLVGKYLDDVPRQKDSEEEYAMVEVSGNKLMSLKSKVKRYCRLERDKHGKIFSSFWDRNWEDLKRAITLGFNNPKIINTDCNLEINEEEHIISIDNGWISIGPSTTEKETIVSFLEVPCWSVSIVTSNYHGQWEPPDCDSVEIGNAENSINAAQLFIRTVWEESNRSFWDSMSPEF